MYWRGISELSNLIRRAGDISGGRLQPACVFIGQAESRALGRGRGLGTEQGKHGALVNLPHGVAGQCSDDLEERRGLVRRNSRLGTKFD